MTDYIELVKALRCCGNVNTDCTVCPWDKYNFGMCAEKLLTDAAAAIEALQAEVKRLEPKRGEWITHPEVKNIYGGVYIECPFCGEKYVVQNVSDEKFCRNCGADLRAKMEVQE